jgi:glycosyltransferase involved in cell wall biosynthesis
VVWAREVPDADLPALYAGAVALVHPARYEGFGFTPLEAMACGAPVIASTAGSLPEVLGDASVYVPPDDAERIAAAMAELSGDGARREVLVARGRAQAARYSWEETARKTLAVYEAALGGA